MNFMITAVPFAIALFLGMLICLEIGRRMGIRRLAADPEGATSGLGVVEAAVFSVYGLLLAFTFSGAPARLDTRKQLIADEANAIGTRLFEVGSPARRIATSIARAFPQVPGFTTGTLSPCWGF